MSGDAGFERSGDAARPEYGLPRAKVLVVGDVMLDRYYEGKVHRISPEAPVPVVSLEKEYCNPGGAAHVAASLAGLGCPAVLGGVVGADAPAAQLREALRGAGVQEFRFVERAAIRTICKTRILADGRQQLLRLDVDGDPAAFHEAAAELEEQVVPLVAQVDAVVLADYAKGTLAASLLATLIGECRRLGRPCIVDPKKPTFAAYSGATMLTPNVHEAARALGQTLDSDAAVAEAAATLRTALALTHMVITRGPDGMTLASAEGTRHFPAHARGVADVTGAGDTVVAVLAACLAARWDVNDACRLASMAAGIAVSVPATYVVGRDELAQAWAGRSDKILDRAGARARIEEAQRRRRRVVFTNGCFDILHAGHLHCLEAARRLGDLLVVGLNSDASVRLNKGDSRPIIGEEHRAALLAALGCVDCVVLFDELTPEDLIRFLQPDVLVKGGDYDPATLAGADFVRGRGGQVVVIPLLEGLSTTAIVARGRYDSG